MGISPPFSVLYLHNGCLQPDGLYNPGICWSDEPNQAHFKFMAGVGLANTFFNVAVTSVSSGYSSIFEAYGPQVHGRSKRKSDLGTVLFKCLLQGILVNLIIVGPYLNLVFIIDLNVVSSVLQSTVVSYTRPNQLFLIDYLNYFSDLLQ